MQSVLKMAEPNYNPNPLSLQKSLVRKKWPSYRWAAVKTKNCTKYFCNISLQGENLNILKMINAFFMNMCLN